MEVMNVTTANYKRQRRKTKMSMFTIDADNNITAHAALPAGADESQSFSTSEELAKLTAEWPASRLVETWNSFAGVAPFDELKPVKKFTNRKDAVRAFGRRSRACPPTLRNRRPTSRPPRGRGRRPGQGSPARPGAKGRN
jgi:hypothetical protein